MPDRAINFGESEADTDFQMRQDGDDWILEHLPSGATFEYDDSETAWIPTAPIGTASRPVPAVNTDKVVTGRIVDDTVAVTLLDSKFDGGGNVVFTLPNASGLLVVSKDRDDAGAALFMLGGNDNQVVEISDPDGQFSTGQGTTESVNVYHDGSDYAIENLDGNQVITYHLFGKDET